MACRTADDTTQYIAATYIGASDTIGNHKGRRTDMIGDQADGYILLLIGLIGNSCHLTDFIADGFHRINIKYGVHILHDNSQSLKTHTGIDILLDQIRIISLTVIVILGEYIVPYFHETIAFTAHLTIRLAAAILDPTIVIDLGTGAAGSLAVLPEVITLSVCITVKLCDLFCRYADLIGPDLCCFVIFKIDGRIQTLRIQSNHFGQKLPAPFQRFMLKIITKGEITQHLKERQMSGRLSDILDITGTHALLTSGHSPSGRHFLPGKIRL